MDIDKYIAGKAKGASSIELHGDSTLLISYPAGFSPADGSPLPPVDKGYQPADIATMKASADNAVQSAQDRLAEAQARAEKFDELLTDTAKFQPQIDANLAAAAKLAAAKEAAANAVTSKEPVG